MKTIDWLITVYPCRGDYCYFGESFCSYFPLHILIPFLIISIVGIVYGFRNLKYWRAKEKTS
ncbi:MAG: hypothetical protein PHS54_01335 [Clostridia bacterium]|nr:hypothetical protein [Clostridia bacterium]